LPVKSLLERSQQRRNAARAQALLQLKMQDGLVL
jgi:hypothetical protein